MAGWNGSGTYSRYHDWTTDEAGAVAIDATRMDQEDDTIAAGINACLAKNGENVPTANLPMGTYKHTGVGNASARTQYAAAGQIQDAGLIYAASSGTDTYTATLSPAITAYATGQAFLVKFGNANTGASTINFNAVGAKSIVKGASTALAAGDIIAGQISWCVYDGTNFILTTVRVAGVQTIWVPAGAMTAATTSGAAAAQVETATNKLNIPVLDFDQTTDEFACFSVRMPKGWNLGTVTFAPSWIAGSTGDVVWGLQAVAISNDDVYDAAYGTAQTSTDSVTATTDLMIGPTSSAITIAGTPAAEDWVAFRVYRDADNGSDTLAADARLVGVTIYYTTTKPTDD